MKEEGQSGAIVYLNGAFLPLSEASISPMDEGFLYGYGLFETMRGYRGHVFAIDRHLERLKKGCEYTGLPFPEGVETTIEALLEMNGLRGRDSYIRITITRGDGKRPTLLIHCRPLPISVERKRRGMKGLLFTVERGRTLAPLKTTSYLLMRSIRIEAERAGKDEGILIDSKGEVLEGSYTNLFLVKEGKVLTPPLSSPILPGITRGIVVELLREAGVQCVEGPVYREDLFRAEEVFLTSSLIEVAPLVELEGRDIGGGDREVTGMVQEAYRRLVDSSIGRSPL